MCIFCAVFSAVGFCVGAHTVPTAVQTIIKLAVIAVLSIFLLRLHFAFFNRRCNQLVRILFNHISHCLSESGLDVGIPIKRLHCQNCCSSIRCETIIDVVLTLAQKQVDDARRRKNSLERVHILIDNNAWRNKIIGDDGLIDFPGIF